MEGLLRPLRAMLLTLPLLLAGCATTGGNSMEAAKEAYLKEDYARALPLMQEAAQGGNAHAQYTLGYMYYHGLGTEVRERLALQWIQRAAEAGEPRAVQALGRLAAMGTDKKAQRTTE